ncbi:MarR family winged helix-turn-helix transcriptional regulator [Methanospirillum stamsii]|uniref:MarR family transcriptional regulator n=1 Tax=Methanospirillum stamsii TaxID=1277351 RepID=A0A2V2N2V1_9EURY|nr:MarR family transcriptional regulator [Methanospirillum stamsii]PWR70497.1 MarR family transcriptional regulator [Methanospirillum stamsii]
MDLGELFLLFIEQYHEVLREADEAEMKATGLPDITIHQFFYLQEIRRQKVTTLTELAKALSISKPSATAVVSRLIKDGFISRTQSEKDQRKYHLSLTEKGHLIFHHKELAYKKFILQVQRCTSEKQQKLLAEAFQIMISSSQKSNTHN